MRLAFLLAFRSILLGLLMLVPVGAIHGGIAPYSDRGKIDFDTAMSVLNPYGTWAKAEGGIWTYTPLDHYVPYTSGRWIYTEYGWTWLGDKPHSWLTEHYGYWKRNDQHVWSWYPGPYWLPQTVEIRAAPTAIGWRSAEVDADGTFVESPTDRYTKVDEWTFVSLQQFADPITPQMITPANQVEGLLEESMESVHDYQTYRDMVRPGPHPADFVNLGDGGMLAPMSPADRAKASRHPAVAKSPAKPNVPPPTLVGVDPENPPPDPRQVKYWITMSLPSLWTPKPPDAKWNEVYLYRPDFWQDQDGIERRISLWLDPSIRATEALHLKEALNGPPVSAPSNAATASADVPAVPAEGAVSDSPFVSPFEDSFHPSETRPTPSASTKSPKLAGGAPPPLSTAGAPVGSVVAPAVPVGAGAATPAPIDTGVPLPGTNGAPVSATIAR